jgi:NAD(P)-dependent dehydrogenase (short-subunit alcohol dehydrogenase family)
MEDKIALITGGASGIGRATAFALAEAGAEVIVADISEDAGREVAEKVGGRFIRVDVSDYDDNLKMVREAGPVDHVFLNAGISTGCGLFDDFDLEKYRRAMGVNLDGVIFGIHAAVPALRERGGGSIVATSSLAGLTGVPLEPIYTANKHGVVGIVRAMGPILAGEHIRINAVCPGFAESALTAPIQSALEEAGFELMKAGDVATVVMQLFGGEMSSECWFVQPGRAGAFDFRHIPGPRKQQTEETAT